MVGVECTLTSEQFADGTLTDSCLTLQGLRCLGVNPKTIVISTLKRRLPTPRLYQRLIELRRELPIIAVGSCELLLEDHPELYAYTRTLGEENLPVILNFGDSEPVFERELQAGRRELVISNYAVDEGEDTQRITLRPYEARVYRFV